MNTTSLRSVRVSRLSRSSTWRNSSGGWDGHGTDLLSDSLAHNSGAPKIILQAHGKSGFDVANVVRNMDLTDQEIRKSKGLVHFHGSILALPDACFLWDVRRPEEITLEKLAPLRLLRPKLEYLFIGSSSGISPALADSIRQQLAAEHHGMVVEPMDLANTMGTFNVLNGEDRRVAAALILEGSQY
jgi:uncharacterized protein